MNQLSNWIAGPQLPGVIILVVGWIMAKYPPKNINPLYGYRTSLSMKNQQTWDEANRFSARLMIRSGWILIFTGLIFSLIISTGVLNSTIQNLLRPLLLIGGSIVSALILIGITEKHLKKTFPENKDEIR